MRGYVALLVSVGLLVVVCGASRSFNTGTLYSARTSTRVVRRLIESAQRACTQHDKSPIVNVAHAACAKTWAESALALASEDAIMRATGCDVTHLVDKSQQKLDGAIIKAQAGLPRRARVSPDRALVM